MASVSRSRSAGDIPEQRSSVFKFSNGDGTTAVDVRELPIWFEINGQEVESMSPETPTPLGANPRGKWLMTTPLNTAKSDLSVLRTSSSNGYQNTPASTAPYKFNNGDGVNPCDVTKPPIWFKINDIEVQSNSPDSPPPPRANQYGRWLHTGASRRRRPSRKYKKSSKRVFRKKSRSTRRR